MLNEHEKIYRRSIHDLWRAFDYQKTSLEISILAFDGGMIGEAARLATSTFLLVGRGMRQHKPILDHLEILDKVNYFPSTVPEGSQSGTPLILACTRVIANPSGNNAQWLIEIESLGKSGLYTGRHLTFIEWWDEIVLKTNTGLSLTREKVVRILRDKDGGAHYDVSVKDPLIISALKGEITGFFYQTPDGKSYPVQYSLEHTMRQIAEELKCTIKYMRNSYENSLGSLNQE